MAVLSQPGKLLPSAHAIEREYRVMKSVANHGVPVPRVLCLCHDDRCARVCVSVCVHVRVCVCVCACIVLCMRAPAHLLIYLLIVLTSTEVGDHTHSNQLCCLTHVVAAQRHCRSTLRTTADGIVGRIFIHFRYFVGFRVKYYFVIDSV